MVKYGTVVFKNTDNIGDDIQSYAVSRFYPRVDYFIDREKIDSFFSDDGNKVAVIMAGWYTHSVLNWPPSPFIYPLEVSMHFTHYVKEKIGNENNNFLDDKVSKDWFELSYDFLGGVGCRDSHTRRLLQDMGIKTFWSGCITLTLEKFKDVVQHGSIICVDCTEQIINQISSKTDKNIIDITHRNSTTVNLDERFELVEELLKLYQGASLVVTTRLHAALPSAALGTPVLLVSNEKTDYRFDDFKKYFACAAKEDFEAGNITYDFNNPIDNSSELKEIGKRLSDICKSFVEHCEKLNDLGNVELTPFIDSVNRMERLKKYIYKSNSCWYINWGQRPTDPFVSYINAMDYYNKQDYESALEEFENSYAGLFADSIEKRWKVFLMIINCLINLGNNEGAKKLLLEYKSCFGKLKDYSQLIKDFGLDN